MCLLLSLLLRQLLFCVYMYMYIHMYMTIYICSHLFGQVPWRAGLHISLRQRHGRAALAKIEQVAVFRKSDLVKAIGPIRSMRTTPRAKGSKYSAITVSGPQHQMWLFNLDSVMVLQLAEPRQLTGPLLCRF